MSGIRYLLALLAVYPLLQLISAAFFAIEFFAMPAGQTSLRLPNVRVLPPSVEHSALKSYFDEVKDLADGKPVVLIAGDSQMYGYFLSAPDTVGAFLEKELPGVSVVNASKVAADHVHSLNALKEAIAEGLRPNVLVVNVTAASYLQTARSNAVDERGVRLGLPIALALDPKTSELFVDLVRRSLLSNRWMFDIHDRVSSPPGDGTYQLAALKADHFPSSLEPEAERDFRELLHWSAGKVKQVVIVASPHYYAPYLAPPYSYSWNTTPVVRRYMEICHEYPHAVCLDLSRRYGREDFHDVIHLTRDGHRKLAHEIAASLEGAERVK